MKSEGVIIAEINVFADGDWEYTGETIILGAGPEGWHSSDLPWIIEHGINHYEQFEILGAFQYVHKLEETA